MPYPTLADLPDAVRNLPTHGQEIWQAAFNAAFAQYDGDEGKSAATAWAAVRKAGYYQDEDGSWRGGKGLLAQLWAAIKAFFVEFEDEPPTATAPTQPLARPADGRLIVIHDKMAGGMGPRRWLGVVANAFYPDRDGQGFTLAALEKAVAQMMATGTPRTSATGLAFRFPDRRVVLDAGHVELPVAATLLDLPLAVGTADHVGLAGPFVVATGVEDNTPVSRRFFDYIEAHPDEDIRMSHLFEYAADQLDAKGVYHDGVEIVRFTALPAAVAANRWTAFVVDATNRGGASMNNNITLDERIRPFLEATMGAEWVAELESGLTRMAEQAVVDGAEVKMARKDTTANEQPEGDPADAAVTEPPVKDDGPAAPPAAATVVIDLSEVKAQLAELARVIAAEKAAREALAAQLAASGATTAVDQPAGANAGRKTNDQGVPMRSPLAR